MSETLSQQEIDALLRMGKGENNQDESNMDTEEKSEHKVDINPVKFQDFDSNEHKIDKTMSNLDIIMDIPLHVTVELGRTKKEIKEILQFSTGSIIELDKLAGEPVDILVNGKYIAKGDVVVIDENFGVRISDIISPSKRIEKMKGTQNIK